jgi:hypothetical protein
MSSTDNILEMFETIMESDMNGEDKLTMIKSLNNLHNSTTEEAELAHDYEEATTPNETFKITLKPSYAKTKTGTNVFGMERWEPKERKELFSLVKDTFGPFSTWKGLATPQLSHKGEYKDAIMQLAKHFGRTPGSIGSQIRDVVRPCSVNSTNTKGIKASKQMALEVGLINESVANS